MERISTKTRLRQILARFRRLPLRFWAALAAVFGVADFLTWSFLSRLDESARVRVTLVIVALALVWTIFSLLQTPTEDESLANARLISRAARDLYNSKDYEEALKMLQFAVKLDPDSTMALGLLGRTLARLGRYSEALPPLSKAIAQSVVEGNRRILRTNRATVNFMLGRFGEALEDLDDNIAEKPELMFSRRLRSLVWLCLERFTNALDDINAALENRPNYLCGHATKAMILHSLGRTEDAVGELAKCEELRPDDADDFYCLALAHSHLGDTAKALDALAIAIERDSKYRSRARGDPLLLHLGESSEFARLVHNGNNDGSSGAHAPEEG